MSGSHSCTKTRSRNRIWPGWTPTFAHGDRTFPPDVIPLCHAPAPPPRYPAAVRCYTLTLCPSGQTTVYTSLPAAVQRGIELTGSPPGPLPTTTTTPTATLFLSQTTTTGPRPYDAATRESIIAQITAGHLTIAAAARLSGISYSRISAWVRQSRDQRPGDRPGT